MIKKEKSYFVVSMLKTDEEPEVRLLCGRSVRELAEKIGQCNMAIFEGNMVKNFDSKADLSKL